METYATETRLCRCDICNWEYLPNTRIYDRILDIGLIDGQMQCLLVRACHSCKEKGFPLTWPLITKIEEFTEVLKTSGREVKLLYRTLDLLRLPMNLLQLEASY